MSDAQIHTDAAKMCERALNHVRQIFKGSGVRVDFITLVSQSITSHHINAGTYLELKPVINQKQGAGGKQVASKEEASKQIDQSLRMAVEDKAIQAQIANVLLNRPDQGFGLRGENIALDFLKKEFSWFETCGSCGGSKVSGCVQCQGRKTEPCHRCSGRGLMPCPSCLSSGLMHGERCTRCLGQRFAPCTQCQRSGQMQCRPCQGRGVSTCTSCSGQGRKSQIMTMIPKATTYFEYDAKAMPRHLADMFETGGARLVLEKKIKITARIADDKPNVLGANYEVEFPFGEAVFNVGKNEAKCFLFGQKPDFVGFPFLLDKAVSFSLRELEGAVKDVGSVADIIRKSTKYRVIARAFLLVTKLSPPKAAANLLKNFDIGLSQGTSEKLCLLAERTTAKITQKPRYIGLAAGVLLLAALGWVFYQMGIRGAVAGFLPSLKFDVLLDLIFIGLGGFIIALCIQFAGAGAIRKALGHLIKADQKNALTPRIGSGLMLGYGACVLIAAIMIYLTPQKPFWVLLLIG